MWRVYYNMRAEENMLFLFTYSGRSSSSSLTHPRGTVSVSVFHNRMRITVIRRFHPLADGLCCCARTLRRRNRGSEQVRRLALLRLSEHQHNYHLLALARQIRIRKNTPSTLVE